MVGGQNLALFDLCASVKSVAFCLPAHHRNVLQKGHAKLRDAKLEVA